MACLQKTVFFAKKTQKKMRKFTISLCYYPPTKKTKKNVKKRNCYHNKIENILSFSTYCFQETYFLKRF